MICPLCGAIVIRQSGPGAAKDFLLFGDEAAILKGCLCFYSLEELEEIFGRFEENFFSVLKEKYPGEKVDAIRLKVQMLPRHSSLRAEIGTKLTVLDRAREVIGKRRKEKKDPIEKEAQDEDIYKRSVRGDSLRTNEWLQSMSGPPPKKIKEE